MRVEKILKHHYYALKEAFADIEKPEKIAEKANEISLGLSRMENPWGDKIYPGLDVEKMAFAHIKAASAMKSNNFVVIDDENILGGQNYADICKACPNFRGFLKRKCAVRRFETGGF